MGCGASVDKRIWGSRKRGKLPAPAPAPQAQPFPRDNIVTPPTGQRGESHGLITHPVNARQNLRIETAHAPAASRREAGLAVTPVGKQADEFRFFCPVCMMFYRSILELECCKQSVCSFCLSEYVQKRTASALASDHRKPVLPAGVACPQCATVNKTRSQLLKTLEAGDVPERAYVTSPKTSQQLEELTSRREQPASPLKVGDDFQTMAKKMLPFESAVTRKVDEDGCQAATCTDNKPGVGPSGPTCNPLSPVGEVETAMSGALETALQDSAISRPSQENGPDSAIDGCPAVEDANDSPDGEAVAAQPATDAAD